EAGGQGGLDRRSVPSFGLPGQGGGHGMADDGAVVGQRGGQLGHAVALQEAGVGVPGQELGMAEGVDQQVAVGGDPVDPGPGQGVGQGGGRLGAGGGVGDDL